MRTVVDKDLNPNLSKRALAEGLDPGASKSTAPGWLTSKLFNNISEKFNYLNYSLMDRVFLRFVCFTLRKNIEDELNDQINDKNASLL